MKLLMYWTHVFNKAIEILYLAEICKYMKTPHSCHDLGPTLDTELNVNKYVRMLNDIDTQQDSQSWASLVCEPNVVQLSGLE